MLLAFALSLTVLSADTVSATNIQRDYARIFRVRIDSARFGWTISADTDTLPTSDRLARFVNPHRQYLTYIAGRPLEGLGKVRLADPAVRDSIRAAYYHVLTADPEYTRAVLVPLVRSLEEHGVTVSGAPTGEVETVSTARAAFVAARFFDPDIVLPNGNMATHVCVVRNGLFGTTRQRDVVLEGLAFEAVWNDLGRPDSTAYVAVPFTKARNDVNALPAGTSREARITAAESLMWREMEASDGLRRLMVAAAKSAPELPIRIDVQ
jgi:hypothetical protein